MKLLKLTALFILTSTVVLNAQLKLPALFADDMVLQQKTNANIWGWASVNESVQVTTSWNNKIYETKANENGKWKVAVETPVAGGPYTVTVKAEKTITLNNVLIGEVWLCSGQSNMEMPLLTQYVGQPVADANMTVLRSKNPNIRLIMVPRNSSDVPISDFKGTWKEASPATTGEFSATAYHFGRLMNEILDVPIGLIAVSYSGSNIEAWMDLESIKEVESDEIIKSLEATGDKNRMPTLLYNGMLKSVIGYTIKGNIWYQGESNCDRPFEYEKLLPQMVELWRNEWGQGEFPFYYVQIAPFNYNSFYNGNQWYANSAYLRDAQRIAQYNIPNSGMACLLDAGDMLTIHPMDKKTPGERLALLALAQTYSFEGFGALTPDYNELNIQDSLVTVTFKNLPNGITSYFKEVTAFEIAGEDKVFYPAKCIVRRKSVQVWSVQVKKPVAIRYAFTNEGPAQLFSADGIPVTSFRTDNWKPEEVKYSK